MHHDVPSSAAHAEPVAAPDGGPATRRRFLGRSGLAAAALASAATARAAGPRTGAGVNARRPGQRFPEVVAGYNRTTFAQIRQHENDHVAALVAALGPAARPKPTFVNLEQPNVTAFVNLSRIFENVGVGAYLGAAPFINSRTILGQAATVATIEARHSAFLNSILGFSATMDATGAMVSFDTPLSAGLVSGLTAPFIASLNGGPPATYSTTISDQNDIAIVNFALVTEYLEAEFYNINVPKFSSQL